MEQKIHLKYYNRHIQVGMWDIKTVYQLEPALTKLQAEVYRGKLVYRARGSNKRVSYEQIKKGLVKRDFFVLDEVPNWLLA